MKRNEKGQFLPGQRMTKKHKKAISRGKIASHRRARQQDVDQPVLKRCSKCGEWKGRKDSFPQRKRKLKSGEVRVYPAGECLVCQAKRSAKWRENLRADPNVAREAYRRWNSGRDKSRRGQYQRDYQRIQRRLEGIPERGPWKRYRDEMARESEEFFVDRKPFDDYLRELNMSQEELSILTELDESVFRIGRYSRVSFSVVDITFTRLGDADQVAVLYPDVSPKTKPRAA